MCVTMKHFEAGLTYLRHKPPLNCYLAIKNVNMKIQERRIDLSVMFFFFFLLESYTDIIVFVQAVLPQPLQSSQSAQ